MRAVTTTLFIVMIAATASGVAVLAGPSLAVQVFITVAFALLGLLTVLLVRRNLMPALSDRTRLWAATHSGSFDG